MLKAKRRFVSLLTACLTAVLALVLGFAALFAPTPITTASAATETSVTLTIKGNTGVMSGTTSISWTQGDVKFTNVKGGTAIRTSDSDHYRAYSGSKNTISVSESTIKKIVITCTSSEYANVCKTSATNANATVSVSSSTVTITPPASTGSEFTFTSSAQWRLKQIVVTYEEAAQCNHDYEWVQENGNHKEVCSLCEEDKPGTSWVACDGDLQYTTLETGANGTHQKVGTCSTCNADLSTDAEDCVFESSIEGTTKTYTCDCGNSYTEEIELRTISFSYPSNVTLNGDNTVSSADDEVLTLPTTNNPDGYIFLGWATASIAGSTETKPTTYKSWTVDGDATLYAVYQKDVQPGGWSAVTDVAELETGDIVTFAYAANNAAIGVSSGTIFTSISATFSNGVLQDSDTTPLTRLTVTKNSNNTYCFYTNDKYLAYTGSGNALHTTTSIATNSSWTVTISGSSTKIANVEYNARYLQYNTSSPRFACYTGTQKDPTIYEFTEGEPISYVTTFCEHDGETTTNTEDPSCTEKGLETVTCNACGAILSTTELPATNHANKTTTTVPANCTDKGSITVTCDDCEATISTEEIPATGHSLDEGVVTTPPQAGVEGVMTYTCQNEGCDYTETDSIPALDAETFVVSYSVPLGINAVADSEAVVEGETVILDEAESKLQYTFVGWVAAEQDVTSSLPEIFEAGSEYTVTENVTLYALYSYVVGSTDWTLVTDVNTLSVGDEIIIAASGNNNFALSNEQNTNNRVATAITKNGSLLSEPSSSVQVITLEAGTKADTFAFNVGTGYLYAASSSANHLKTQTTNNDNGSWSISITPAGVATIQAQGSYTRNTMRFNPNNDSPIFSCYSSNTGTLVEIYKIPGSAYYTTNIDCRADIDSARPTVEADITLNYYVELAEDLVANTTMQFVVGENMYEVAPVKEVGGTRYFFPFPVAPNCMTVEIAASLMCNGVEVDKIENYSVKQYAQNKLNDSPSDELKALLTAMLYYGDAAQAHEGLEVNTTAGVTGLVEVTTPSISEDNAMSLVKNEAVETYAAWFTSANVWFSSVNKIRVTLNTAENVTLKINGVDVPVNSTTIYTDGIAATQFGEKVTFELYHDGILMQTLQYSIYSYAYSMQNSAKVGELVKALYRYGEAAITYRDAQ